MVPCFRCSSTNFFASSISAWVKGRSRPGKVVGAPGSSSIVWSQMVWLGSLWDSCSLKILQCLWYSSGSPSISSVTFLVWLNVTRPMKNWSLWVGQGMFRVLGMKRACLALFTFKTIGSWVWSIHPRFQSIFGCMAANHGYPRIALCSPKSDRKNHRSMFCPPVRTCKSM